MPAKEVTTNAVTYSSELLVVWWLGEAPWMLRVEDDVTVEIRVIQELD